MENTKSPAGSATGFDLDRLEQLAREATPGPWKWWTSNSEWRLTGADGCDGGVLDSFTHRGHASIVCKQRNADFIAAANPATVLELIALARATPQHPDLTATHGPLHLTNMKTKDIAGRGYNIVGYVLRRADGEKVCISAESAVRWLPQAHYWRLMHEQDGSLFADAATPQHSVTEQPSIDTPEFRRLFDKYDSARGVANINQAYRDLIAYIDERAPSRDESEGAAQGDFSAWLAREMPAGTVISDPAWWAPRILRAAQGDVARDAIDWREFVRRAKLIYNEDDEGMQALDYLLALVDTSIIAGNLAAMSAPATSKEKA